MPGLPGPQGANRRGSQQGCDRTTAPSPRTLTYLRPPRAPAAAPRRLAAQLAGGPREPGAPGPQVRRRQEREPGLPVPKRWRAVRARAAE